MKWHSQLFTYHVKLFELKTHSQQYSSLRRGQTQLTFFSSLGEVDLCDGRHDISDKMVIYQIFRVALQSSEIIRSE